MRKYKAKISVGGEIIADDAVIKKISDQPIDVYASVSRVKSDELKLIVAFNLGSAFLNSSQFGSQFREARSMLYEFGYELSKESYSNRLKHERQTARALENQHKDLLQQKEKLEESIELNQKRIKDAEQAIRLAQEAITKNLDDQQKKKVEIQTQLKVIDEVSLKERSFN
jgi:hypothetical protein